MNKTRAKLPLILAVILAAALFLPACGGGSSDSSNSGSAGTAAASSVSGTSKEAEPASAAYTGDKYVFDGETLTNSDLPENYTPIPYDTFVEGFRFVVKDGASATYEDIAEAFGDDGIRMDGMTYEGYAYYSWVSDKDYTDSSNVNVLITFKANGDALTYYSYTSYGIFSEDVE